MNETVEIRDRTFTRTIKNGGVTFTVESISHDSDWGPKAARIRCDGTLEALNKLLLQLRCELTVRDGASRETWWGCIWSVEIYKGSIKYGLTLDGFANKINVVYLQQTINQQYSGAGTQAETGFGSDTASIAEYGTFEQRARGGNSSSAAASAERAKELANRAKPQSIGTTVGGGSPDAAYAIINCWGWKKTLDKRFYTNSTGGVAGIESNEVITSEVAAALGFGVGLTGVSFVASSDKIFAPGTLPLATGSYFFVQDTASNNKAWTVTGTPDGPGASVAVTPTNVTDEASGTASIIYVGTKFWQPFSLGTDVPFYAAAIDIRLKKTTGVADNVTVKLYTVSGGLPDTLLATGTIANDELATSLSWATAVLNTQPQIVYGTTYGILVERSVGAYDDTGLYIGLDEALSYTRGSLQLYTDATNGWKSRPTDADLIFKISGIVETTTQIDTAVTSVGEFISDVVIDSASGLKTLPYRDGSETCLQVVQDLQSKGTSNNKRLLSKVTPKRELVLYEEPSPTAATAYRLRDDGLLYTMSGQPIPPHVCPVGQWATVDDLVLAQVPAGSQQVFIDEVEYRPKDGTFRIVRTRDRQDDISMVGY